MVPYLGGIVEDSCAGRIAARLFDHRLQVGIGQIGSGDQFGQVVHVGLVVFAVMEIDGIRTDDRRQGILGIRQFR